MNYQMRLHSLKKFFSLALVCWVYWLSAQHAVVPKPDILYPIYDEVGILTQQERDLLNQKLIKFEDSTSTEIEVIIIPSTKGEDVNFLAAKYGQQWGIGKKKTDNGVVFLIAVEDRQMSIQQGRAVEQYLTASVAGQILDYLVTPHFRKGNFYKGINQGTDAIMEAVQGKFKPEKQEEDSSIILILIIIFAVIVLLIIVSNSSGGGGTGRNFDHFDDVIITRHGRRNYPGGFGSFPSFGKGGFGGFGGGGTFGGGGASGSW